MMVSPGPDQGVHHRGVGLRAGVRLDVGVPGAEQGLDPVDRELLDHVNVLAAAVVALARVALGVLVGQHRTLRLHHGLGGVVLRGDHFQAVTLAGQLGVDLRGDLRIQRGQVRVQARGDDLLKRTVLVPAAAVRRSQFAAVLGRVLLGREQRAFGFGGRP